jgi:hypothetical protein
MLWQIRLWGAREILAAIIVFLMLASLLAAMIWYPEINNPGREFGPEWTCSQPGQGDPVCVKNVPQEEPSGSTSGGQNG